jgi:hypothetical protein
VSVCAYRSWEIALNVVLDVSFDNMSGWKGARRKPEGLNGTKARVAANDENYRAEFSAGAILADVRD